MKNKLLLLALLSLGQLNLFAQNLAEDKIELILPTVDFQDTPFIDAIAFIQQSSADLAGDKKGLNLVVLESSLNAELVTLKLHNLSFREVVHYTALQAGGFAKVGKHAITIDTLSTDDLKGMQHDSDTLTARLKTIIVPSIQFRNTPLNDALDFLRHRAKELDPKKVGINIVFLANKEKQKNIPTVSLNLTDIPLLEAIEYTAQIAKCTSKVETNVVALYQE